MPIDPGTATLLGAQASGARAMTLPGGTKFWLGMTSIAAVVAIAVSGTMDTNVAAILCVINGGYSWANASITRQAIAQGKEGES